MVEPTSIAAVIIATATAIGFLISRMNIKRCHSCCGCFDCVAGGDTVPMKTPPIFEEHLTAIKK